MNLEQAIADQYQIGDRVVYTPEGIVTRVSGYLWLETMDGRPPQIGAYQLDCGIAVQGESLCRAPAASGGFVHFGPFEDCRSDPATLARKLKGVRSFGPGGPA